MTDLTLPQTVTLPARAGLGRALVILALLVALGDWLCLGAPPGVGIGLFAGCVIAAAYGAAHRRVAMRRLAGALLIAFIGDGPWLMAPGVLSLCFMIVGTAFAVAYMADAERAALWRRTVGVLGGIGWRIGPDLVGGLSRLRPARGTAILLSWLLPALGGLLFLALFASANPVIAASLTAGDPLVLLSGVSPMRCLVWVLIACIVWPALVPAAPWAGRLPGLRLPAGAWQGVFDIGALSRALILFNLLFAVETGLDAAYLWGGLRLPADLTYSDYAHRGAYTLIAAALVAGGFAILATRPGSAAAASRRVRLLVLIWSAQTLALVGSSIFRLRLYVQAYSLTELRLVAFIWMLLVFAGLVFIVLRILLARSDLWLLRANMFAAVFTLYAVCCLNVPWIVAQYDVVHCREVTGTGALLDFDYLVSLGPQAIPALDHYRVVTGDPRTRFLPQGQAGTDRDALAAAVDAAPGWRGDSVWAWVLRLYLATHDFGRH